ncbi:MAG: TrmH family RNA methyltransferase, partial [Gemmataceae bacterium]
MLPCRIVLVRTEIAANIGSVARIMRNFDAGDLVLVQPIADPMAEAARQLATHHGFPILEKARVVADLQTALHGCV